MIHDNIQSSSLIRFLNKLNKGTITNRTGTKYSFLVMELSFVSKYFTPVLKISEVSEELLTDIRNDDILTTGDDYTESSIIKKVEASDLEESAPNIYKLLQMVILESYTIVNCFTENTDNIKRITEEDVKRVRENLNYVADFMGSYPRYSDIIPDLRELDICFGYIEHQLPQYRGGLLNGSIPKTQD